MVTARLAPAQAIQKSLQVLGKIVPVDGRDPDNRLGGNESLIVFRKIIIDHAPAFAPAKPPPIPARPATPDVPLIQVQSLGLTARL